MEVPSADCEEEEDEMRGCAKSVFLYCFFCRQIPQTTCCARWCAWLRVPWFCHSNVFSYHTNQNMFMTTPSPRTPRGVWRDDGAHRAARLVTFGVATVFSCVLLLICIEPLLSRSGSSVSSVSVCAWPYSDGVPDALSFHSFCCPRT